METKPYTEVMFIYKENGVEKWRSEEHIVDVGDAAWRNLIVPRFNDQIKLGFKGTHIDQLGSGAQTTFTNSRGEVITCLGVLRSSLTTLPKPLASR